MKNYNIPIFVPHEGCPFNCIFCNQKRITGVDTSITAEEIVGIIEAHLKTLPAMDRYVEAAFFGGSFTGISAKKQEEFLSVAYEYVKSRKIDGIRLSTRPDYISDEIAERLLRYGVTSVELGVQSMDNGVLKAAARGHTEKTVSEAVAILKKYPFKLGLQMMTGLPGCSDETAIKTAQKIIALKPDFVRIYPTLVVSDTPLARMYERGEYTPQTVEAAVALCKKLLLMFRENNIDVIRVSLQPTEEIAEGASVVAGPFHSSFRELVEGEIYFDEICKILDKNADIDCLWVNPKEISKAVGNKRKNILRIKELYNTDLKIKPSCRIEKGRVEVWKE